MQMGFGQTGQYRLIERAHLTECARILESVRLLFETSVDCPLIGECPSIRECPSVRGNTVYSKISVKYTAIISFPNRGSTALPDSKTSSAARKDLLSWVPTSPGPQDCVHFVIPLLRSKKRDEKASRSSIGSGSKTRLRAVGRREKTENISA